MKSKGHVVEFEYGVHKIKEVGAMHITLPEGTPLAAAGEPPAISAVQVIEPVDAFKSLYDESCEF